MMAQISLRDYDQMVQDKLKTGQAEEAIEDCRYILAHFPKHVDTYRLLGRALLEGGYFDEAADTYERVLSSVPDDSASHVAMSVLREEQGDLEGALWHMERAFELEPSNSAVQGELQRLYRTRNGVAPEKLYLNKGALVRIHTRDGQYEQAVQEIRQLLEEDPSRLDLEVVLARTYYLMGDKQRAIEVSQSIVEKSPYCFEANRILAELLPATAEPQKAQDALQRLLALDPYASLGHLAGEEVTLPSLGEAEEPTATSETGSAQPAAATGEEEELPAWLSAFSTEQASGSEELPATPAQPEKTGQGEAFPFTPETEAGSEPAIPEQAYPGFVGQPAESSPQEEQSPAESENAPLPDWLKALQETMAEREEEPFAGMNLPGETPTAAPAEGGPGSVAATPTPAQEGLQTPSGTEEEEVAAPLESQQQTAAWLPEEQHPAEELRGLAEEAAPAGQSVPAEPAAAGVPSSEDLRGADFNSLAAQLRSSGRDAVLSELSQRIIRGEGLAEIISLLQSETREQPQDMAVWQLLGDACAKDNRFEEALQAYSQAEALLSE